MNNLEPAEPFKSLFQWLMEVPQEDLDAIGMTQEDVVKSAREQGEYETYQDVIEGLHALKDCGHDMGVRFSDLGMFCSDCGEYITDDGEYIPNHYGEE